MELFRARWNFYMKGTKTDQKRATLLYTVYTVHCTQCTYTLHYIYHRFYKAKHI